MNTLLGFPEGGSTLPFGRILRQWRGARHMSQLALATEAGISTRHLSFLETGRAQPSREMVQLLAGMLDVPLGERNALLVSAGYAPVYGDRPLGAPELEPVRRALQFILRQQEPFPALVVDGQWNIVMSNDASRRIFQQFRGAAESANVMRTVFDPRGLRAFIVNWEEVAECLMHSIHRRGGRAGQRGGSSGCATSCSPTRVCRHGGRRPTRCWHDAAAGRHAAAQRRPVDGLLLDGHDVRHASRRRAAAAEDRVLLPG